METSNTDGGASVGSSYPAGAQEQYEAELAECVLFFGFEFVRGPSGWTVAEPHDSRR